MFGRKMQRAARKAGYRARVRTAGSRHKLRKIKSANRRGGGSAGW